MNKSDISKIPQQVGSRSKNKTSASWWPNTACTTAPWKSMTAFVFTCVVRCVPCHAHTCKSSQPSKEQWDFSPWIQFWFFFFNKCPHSLSCYLIFSLFTIKIIFKPDHFLFFPFFFLKESLGQRENCWAETQSKADSAHASLFSIFIPAQLWLETSVSDSWWTRVPGIQNIIFSHYSERCETMFPHIYHVSLGK